MTQPSNASLLQKVEHGRNPYSLKDDAVEGLVLLGIAQDETEATHM